MNMLEPMPEDMIKLDGSTSKIVRLPNEMNYDGTLRDVLDNLEVEIAKIGRSDSVTFDAPRIIRATVDYKILHPSEETEQLVETAIKLALEIYRGSSKSKTKLREFRELVDLKHPQLLDAQLRQKEDGVTWKAMQREKSIETANELAEVGGRVLFIALGHGGVAAGMDVFNDYCSVAKENEGSEFYVVRFSTQKAGDDQPQVTDNEIRALRNKSLGKRIIIFDEDIASGRTISKANEYFSRMFSRSVKTVTNMTIREALGPATLKKPGLVVSTLEPGVHINQDFDGLQEKYITTLNLLKWKKENPTKQARKTVSVV